MTLLIGERLGSQIPVHQSVPRGELGYGERAADLAALAGLDLDVWQRYVLDSALARVDGGRWAAFEVALIVARQNGKGSILEALELAGLFLHSDTRQILHSAHEFKTAKEAFRRIVSLIKEYPRLEAEVDHIRYTTGEEGIETKDGSRLRFVARSHGSGRGFTADLIILDEAYNLSTDMMAALLPTLSARPNPQLWYTSSAPLETPLSDVLRKVCLRGRSGESKNLAYYEWCAPADDVDTRDRDAWVAANPALNIRISEDFVEKELEALGEEGFRRERLGIWPEELGGTRIISLADWAACADAMAPRPTEICVAFDVAYPDRASGAIGVAGLLGDKTYIDIALHAAGTGWMVTEIKRLVDQYRPARVVCDLASPAGSLLPALEAEKVEIQPMSLREHQQACGAFFDDVKQGRLVHPDVEVLNAAVAGADRRPVGDSWLWSRKHSSVDISPLVAVTLARWAAAQAPAKRVLTEASVW